MARWPSSGSGGPHAPSHATGATDELTPAAIAALPASQKGAANGVASLGADSKVPAAQLPASSGGGEARGDYKPAHFGLLAASFDPRLATGGPATASGYIHFTKVWLESATAIARMHFWVFTARTDLRVNECWGGVYNAAGTLLGRSGDLSGVLATAGFKAITLTAEAGQSLPVGGTDVFVHFALLTNGPSQPVIYGLDPSNIHNVNLSLEAGNHVRSDLSGFTALPAARPALADDVTRPFWIGAS